MCGICGTVALGDGSPDPSIVAPMLGAMVHRGPDSEGLFTKPGIAAGIRRLAVIDVEGGDQPLTNEDGTVHVVTLTFSDGTNSTQFSFTINVTNGTSGGGGTQTPGSPGGGGCVAGASVLPVALFTLLAAARLRRRRI